jgi:ketosteroid isomerase-like protein
MINLRIAALVIMLIFLGGCMKEVDLEKEKSNLINTDKEFAAKSNEVGPAEAFYRFMDNEGIQLPINGDAVVGNQAIRNRMLKAGEYQLFWIPKKAEVSESADMGWTWGTYIYQAKDEEGNAIKRKGKYLNVWKKQADGSWKVAVDIGNIEPEEEK